MMTASKDALLEYSPRLPWHRRRRIRRLSMWTALAVATGALILWGPSAWERCQLLYRA